MTPPRLLTAVLFAVLGCLLAVGIAWRPALPDPPVKTTRMDAPPKCSRPAALGMMRGAAALSRGGPGR